MARLKKDDPRMLREGDHVRVLIPKRLIRVGYENNVRDVKTEILNALCKVRKKDEEEVIDKVSEKSELIRRFKGGEITPMNEFNEWFRNLEAIVKRNFNCKIYDYRDKF